MIGKWNKSVILTYMGTGLAVLSMLLLSMGLDPKYAIVCFIYAGVCDMFDGTVARRCKRTEDEKRFGIELDSLADVVSFVALPIVILLSMGLNKIYCYPVYVMYAIFGIARLAHFNITVEDTSIPRKYYEGMPVTLTALIFPLTFIFSFFIDKAVFNIFYLIEMLVVGILFIVKIKIPKPNLKVSLFLLLLAVIFSILYLFVL